MKKYTQEISKVIWEGGPQHSKFAIGSSGAPHIPLSPPKKAIPVDQSPNPTTCFIPGPHLTYHPKPLPYPRERHRLEMNEPVFDDLLAYSLEMEKGCFQ